MKQRTNIQVEHSTLMILRYMKKGDKTLTYNQLLMKLINSYRNSDPK